MDRFALRTRGFCNARGSLGVFWMAPMIRRIFAPPRSASDRRAAPALAAPKANTITAIGGMKVKANAYVQDDQRWDADRDTVKSGATVTLATSR